MCKKLQISATNELKITIKTFNKTKPVNHKDVEHNMQQKTSIQASKLLQNLSKKEQ